LSGACRGNPSGRTFPKEASVCDYIPPRACPLQRGGKMIVFLLCLLSFLLGIIVGIVFGFYVSKKAVEEILEK